MKRVIKIRFYPNQTQRHQISTILGCCRFIRNKYIEMEKSYYNETGKFLSGYDFDKLVTEMKSTTEFEWLNHCSRKALQDAIMAQEKAFKRFFKKKQGYPKFISKKRQRSQSYFFVKNNIHFDTGCKNVISIPILGKVRITERNHLPDESKIVNLDKDKKSEETKEEGDKNMNNTEDIEIDMRLVDTPIPGPCFHGESWYKCPKCKNSFEYYDTEFGRGFVHIKGTIYKHTKNDCNQLIDMR